MPFRERVRAAGLIDLLVVALFAVLVLVHLTGGFVSRPFGIRVSVTSADRVFLWMVVLVVIRHVLVPRPSLVESIRSRLRLSSQAALPAAAAEGRQAATLAAALVFFALATVVVLHGQARDMYGLPDLGDPLFSVWRLSWIAHQAPRDPGSLFDANIFHPEPATLAYSDAMLLTAAVAAPFGWLGVHPVVIYNVLLLASFALAGWAMFVLIWRLTGKRSAALVAGLVFAFYSYRFSHYSHLELLITMWMPLALLSLHRLAETGRVRDGILLGLMVGAQALSSMYYGLFLATYVVAVAVCSWALSTMSFARMRWPLLFAVTIATLLVAPLARPYLQARAAAESRPVSEVQHYSAQPRDYAAVHHRSRLYQRAPDQTDNAERQLFPGFVPAALGALALWPPLSAVRLAYFLALLVAIETSLGLNGEIYPWLYKLVFPFQGLRAPARFGMLVGLSLAVLAGLGFAHVASRWPPARRRLIAAICGLAMVAEAWPTALNLKQVSPEPPPIYQRIPPGAVVAALPFPEGEKFWIDPTYMYFSTFGWPRLLNGASGLYPRWYGDVWSSMQQFPAEPSLRTLERHHVQFVLIHGGFYEPQKHREVVDRLDRERQLRLIESHAWQGDEYRLYEVVGTHQPSSGATR